MNKDYTYLCGKVIVTDEMNKKRTIDYHDNIDQVLVTENAIEEIDNRLKEYKSRLNASIEHEAKPALICGLVAASIVVPPLIVLGAYGLKLINPKDIENFMFAAKVSSGVNSSVFSIMGIIKYREYLNDKRHQNGLKLSIDYLETRKKGETEKLKRLNNTTVNSKLVFKEGTKTVNDLDIKQDIKKDCNFYYKLGYNGKKYLKLLKKGILESTLADEFDEPHATEALYYIDGNQYTLAKKYR